MSQHFLLSAKARTLSVAYSVGLDGYDLFMAEAAIAAGMTQIATMMATMRPCQGLQFLQPIRR
jgi:hypothetical protein